MRGDTQCPPLLLELDKRQTVVRQMSHDGGSHPLDRTTVRYSDVALPLAYKSPANFNELAPNPCSYVAPCAAATAFIIVLHRLLDSRSVLASLGCSLSVSVGP